MKHSARNDQAPTSALLEIPLASITPSAQNPRKRFDEEALQELAASIQTHGVLEPILVRPTGATATADGPEFRYEIVVGERRYRAAAIAGLETIPACVRDDLDERSLVEVRLIENLQRQDLDPIEEAQGYQSLQELGYTQQQIGDAVHRAQPTVANRMRLLRLPEDVRERISRGELTASHGIALCRHEEKPLLLSALAAGAGGGKLRAADIDQAVDDEGRMPWSVQQTMIEAGSGVRIAHDTAFDWRRVCERCPFGALVGDQYNPICLRPEHYAELQAAATAEQHATQKKQIADALAKAGTQELMDLSKLPHASYVELEFKAAPAGCTKDDCPSYMLAKSQYRGDAPVHVCLDAKCYQKLHKAEEKAKKTALRVKLQAEIDRVRAAELTPERAKRAVAWLAAHAMFNVPMSVRRKLGQRFPEGSEARAVIEQKQHSDDIRANAQALLEIPLALEIAIFAVGALVEGAIAQHLETGYTRVPTDLIEFYCGKDAEDR